MKGYGRYSQAYQKAAVTTVDQRKLIVMLYDGAIRYLTVAAEKLEENDHYEGHTNLIRGKSIVAELLASLNLEQGGEIARNLQRLYTYMFNELVDANVNKDASRVHQVINLLKELRVGWSTMNKQPEGAPQAAQQGGQPQQGAQAGQSGQAAPGQQQRKSINVKG